MSERKEVSVNPAVAAKKVPGLHIGEQTAEVLYVIYNDGTSGYRCVVCQKEYDTFGSCWAHKTHHTRDPLSYKWKSHGSGKGKNSLQATVEQVLTQNMSTLAEELVELLTARTSPQLAMFADQVGDLKAKLDEERKARIKAERDLNKIRKLFNPSN